MDRASPEFVYKLGRLGKYVVILKLTVASPGWAFSVVDIVIAFQNFVPLPFFRHSPSCTLLQLLFLHQQVVNNCILNMSRLKDVLSFASRSGPSFTQFCYIIY